MNGLISFNQPISSYDTRGWPETAYNLPASFLAVFYADTNSYFIGQIKHKQIVNRNELDMAAEYIAGKRNLTGLNANYMYLAEWEDMAPCNCYFPVSNEYFHAKYMGSMQKVLFFDFCTYLPQSTFDNS